LLEYRPFQEAGFDCEKAETPIEYAICTDDSDARLAFLDRSIAQWYSLQRQKLEGEEKARLRSDQRDWIKARNTKCADADRDCLRMSYIERLRDMGYPHMKELESQ
ncbi:MAG: lysozyme inhibitor LprI family protein, partial [Alphaproteobacteria bacterium]|nr:lysozyme inhibitor LprI family protein [Alphaproteobacteria bacterium]